MRAVISKELRELIWLLPVGLVFIGLAVWFSLPQIHGWQETGLIPTCAALFAGLLAAMQGFFDLSDRQRGFLFHRALSRSQILYGKVLAALVIYSVAVAIPLALLALYFARIGLEYQPVDPIQLLPTLALCLAGFAIHPAALLTIDREASWFGTRLFPLAMAIASLIVLTVFSMAADVTAVAWCTAAYLVVLGLLLIALQQRNFVRAVIVAGGALCTVLAAIVFGASMVESLKSPSVPYTVEFGIDSQGEPWVYQSRYDYSPSGYSTARVPVSGDRLRTDREPNLDGSLPKDFQPVGFSWLYRLDDNARRHRYQYSGNIGRKNLVSAPNGTVLVYDSGSIPPLQGVVTRSGFRAAGDSTGKPFNGDALVYGFAASSVLTTAGYESLWIDRDGVYQFDSVRGEITPLVELPVQSVVLLPGASADSKEKRSVHLWMETATEARLYKLIATTGEVNWFDSSRENNRPSLPLLKAELERTLPRIPKEVAGRVSSLALTPEGHVVALAAYSGFKRAVIANEPNAAWEIDQLVAPKTLNGPSLRGTGVIALTPPGVLGVLAIFAIVYSAVNQLPNPMMNGVTDGSLQVLLLIGVTAALGSVVGVWLLGRRRGLSPSANLTWCLGTLLAGVATPLMLIALYPRVYREACPRCERMRRIDRNSCPHCGNPWEAGQGEGIEIVDFEVRGGQAAMLVDRS